MFVVYYVSVSSLGTIVTDFTNDTLFAEWIQPPVGEWLSSIGAADWLNGCLLYTSSPVFKKGETVLEYSLDAKLITVSPFRNSSR